MRMRPFKQVDVFTDRPFLGNALAVVLDGEDLPAEEMQRFADWTNLSEATFLLPPQDTRADYRVRIFAPGRELPFAGHPTIGSCHAWLEAGGRPRRPEEVVQECAAGLVRLRRDGGRLAFAAPPLLRSGPLDEPELLAVAAGLGIDPGDIAGHAWCDNGPGWRAVLLRSVGQVLSLRPDAARLASRFVGVAGPIPPGAPDGCAFEVRAFFPGPGGFAEDPVTGSLNAALGQWLIGAGLAPAAYIARQGTVLGRAGRVHVRQDAEDRCVVWVGGDAVTCIDGSAFV